MLPSRNSVKVFSPMTVLVKKRPTLSVPEAIQREAGIKPGDVVEFKVVRGTITIYTTKLPPAEYIPTKAEAASIRKGRAAYKRGEYVTLNQLHHELDTARRQARQKSTRKTS